MASKTEFLKSVLYPVVRVRAKKAAGSGTVVFSQEVGGDGETYILTNHHVIESLIKVDKKYDSFLKRNLPKESRGTATVEFFSYQDNSRLEGTLSVQADIVAYSESHDLALLKLRSTALKEFVANLPLLSFEKDLDLADAVVAVGAALGHAPVITRGHITFMDDEIEDLPFWMSDAPIIFGNSGGAIFAQDSLQWVGVPSRISITQVGWSIAPISHLGFFIPFTRVYEWLEEEYYEFIFDPELSAEACHEARTHAQEEMSRMIDVMAVQEQRAHESAGRYNKADSTADDE